MKTKSPCPKCEHPQSELITIAGWTALRKCIKCGCNYSSDATEKEHMDERIKSATKPRGAELRRRKI